MTEKQRTRHKSSQWFLECDTNREGENVTVTTHTEQSSTVAGVWWLKVQQTFWFTKSFHDVFGGVLAVWVWGIWLFDVTFVWAAAHSYIGHNHNQAGETSQQQHQEQQSRKGQQAFRVPDRRNTHTDQTGAFITKWECFSEEMAERSHDTLVSLHCTLTHE